LFQSSVPSRSYTLPYQTESAGDGSYQSDEFDAATTAFSSSILGIADNNPAPNVPPEQRQHWGPLLGELFVPVVLVSATATATASSL
jgi:hypothetical protein